MMLEHLGEKEAAPAVVAAIETVLSETTVRTPDLGGDSSTAEVTDAILDALGS